MNKTAKKPASESNREPARKAALKAPPKPAPARHPEHHRHAADILVAKVPSPLGTLLLYTDAKGLVALDFPGAEAAEGSAVVSLKGLKERDTLKAAAGALNDYFAKGRPLPRALRGALDGTEFQKKVWAAIEKIPMGKTKSYAEIAAQIGHPGASRAVGTACGANPLPLFVPCHRVLAASGKIGGFSGGLAVKRLLLRHEGVDAK